MTLPQVKGSTWLHYPRSSLWGCSWWCCSLLLLPTCFDKGNPPPPPLCSSLACSNQHVRRGRGVRAASIVMDRAEWTHQSCRGEVTVLPSLLSTVRESCLKVNMSWPYLPGETLQDESCGARSFKASTGHMLLGSRTRKLFCFSFYNPEAIGPLEEDGLEPFSWSLCSEEREYITFSRERLEAVISHPGSQPQPSTETYQVSVSAQTFIRLVFESDTDRFLSLCTLGTWTCAWLGARCGLQKLPCTCRTWFKFGSF